MTQLTHSLMCRMRQIFRTFVHKLGKNKTNKCKTQTHTHTHLSQDIKITNSNTYTYPHQPPYTHTHPYNEDNLFFSYLFYTLYFVFNICWPYNKSKPKRALFRIRNNISFGLFFLIFVNFFRLICFIVLRAFAICLMVFL